jgi:2-dehydropantoate 2-reductase
MQPLLGSDTALVTAVNGVPWWYFHNLGGDYEGRRVEAVDPGNVQWDGIGPERAIGCVVYPACEIVEPGVVQHISGNKFTLGEPSGEKTHRIESLSQALIAANMKAPVRPRIRDEIWIKLWGNLSFNPISVLTSATLEEIAGDEGTRAVVNAMMIEAQAVGEALGVNFPVSVDKRINGAGAVGAHKTSMLQDLELGRPMEIDALVAAVSEMGDLVGIKTPTINTILALVRQRARVAGCY